MVFAALLIAGLLLIRKVPVSLLPNVDVPQIIVQVSYPNTAAPVMEQQIIAPIRESLGRLGSLNAVESQSANHSGIIQLTFDYGTRMDLAYIEVNERLDKITQSMPRDMQRPLVMRVNTADIPIVRIQVIPKDEGAYDGISRLTEAVLKRRIEQIDGVSLVDINGLQQQVLAVIPDKEALAALNLDEGAVAASIENANRELGGLQVKDGQYQYFVKLANVLEDEAAIAALPLLLQDGSVIQLGRVARVIPEKVPPAGYHLYNGKECFVITVQKQASSRMNELVPRIREAVDQFARDYPQVAFALSQDQTFLLDAGISNLEQDLIYGGIFTALLLFLFLGNWASPSLMSISIPLSLIITFLFFYLFDISFNIISLSGLALGVGMVIDNSIVVIDNITRKRSQGLDMLECSVQGTNEVIAPVISQVLTTIAVYAPLILLSGIAGLLVFDQAIGLTICLCVSLLVAFVLAPLLYRIFLTTHPDKLKKDTRLYAWVAKGYHRMIGHILRRKLLYFLATLLIMPAGIWLAARIPVSALPEIEKKESLVLLDWNDPIDARENLRRVKELLSGIPAVYQEVEADIGIKQFLLQQGNNTIQKAEIYIACEQERQKVATDAAIRKWLRERYPLAGIRIIDAPNAFTQLFSKEDAYFEARFKPLATGGDHPGHWDQLTGSLQQLPDTGFVPGEGFVREQSVTVLLDYDKMNTYGVTRKAIEEVLQQQFGVYTISQIKRYGAIQTVRLVSASTTVEARLMTAVKGRNGNRYALHQFVALVNDQQTKFITADRSGPYRAIVFDRQVKHIPELEQAISRLAMEQGFSVSFAGSYYSDQEQLQQLWFILLLVLLLLYFILAIQYESLVQPVIVMLTIPLGITGGMLLLWLTGGTLDVMAAIGFIVILGLIVDDPILKIETLNRLEKKYFEQGLLHDDRLLEKMIHEAGDTCLKPLLMVSLTTSIALVPVLFVSGIGNDLQKPLAIVIIGGLTIGTFFTTWFIPLAYWYVTKLKIKRSHTR